MKIVKILVRVIANALVLALIHKATAIDFWILACVFFVLDFGYHLVKNEHKRKLSKTKNDNDNPTTP